MPPADTVDPPPVKPMTKRTLIIVSHAIEQAAVAAVATADEPVVLIALFQRPMYFDRERQAYRELARTTTLTIVGVVDTEPDVAPGVEGIALRPDEPLAAEWSVIMLTPKAGAALVATDREDLVPGAATIESGRLFDGWFSFHRHHAAAQVARLRRDLSGRLSHHADIVIGEVLDEAYSRLVNPAEQRTDAAIRLLVDAVESSHRRARSLHGELTTAGLRGGVDILTGLRDRGWLEGFLGRGSGTASDTLSLALIRLDIDGLDHVNRWAGKGVGDDLLRHVAMLVRRPLRDVDHAVRLQDDDLLLVLPNVAVEQATRLATQLCAEVSALRSYPTERGGVSMTAAVTVTRDRPLPLSRLDDALAHAKRHRVPVVVAEDPLARQPVARPSAAASPFQDAAASVRPYVTPDGGSASASS